jgi:hypothetical protein
MQIPEAAQVLINNELRQLAGSTGYSLPAQSRIEIYAALGASNFTDEVLEEARENHSLPHLSAADRVRAQVALITARKVVPLWEAACRETELFFTQEEWQMMLEEQKRENVYLRRRKNEPIEMISVYEVPRAFTLSHILEMAELALAGSGIHDVGAFRREANEWWEIYQRPERMEREFCIKWAAQDALYEAIGWIQHGHEAPAEDALYAFAGIFEGEDVRHRRWRLDKKKAHDFWVWWLSEAIPLAHG